MAPTEAVQSDSFFETVFELPPVRTIIIALPLHLLGDAGEVMEQRPTTMHVS